MNSNNALVAQSCDSHGIFISCFAEIAIDIEVSDSEDYGPPSPRE